jgi:hypothetical protein
LVGIQVGVGFGNRPVTPAKYAEYIRALKNRRDVDVVVTGYSEKEKSAAMEIQRSLGNDVMLALGFPIQDLMGLISILDVCVSVDTGPFHMAAALGTPQLAIFPSKKVKPLSWGPWRNKHFIVREAHTCAYFCPHEGCPLNVCSDNLRVSDMVAKTEKLLDGGGIEKAAEQFVYWFENSMHILVLHDEKTREKAQAFHWQLGQWGLRAFLERVDRAELYKTVTENDVSIIHNLSGKRKWRLFWLSQRANKFLHNPPLVVHSEYANLEKGAVIENYRLAFEKKLI